MCGSWVVGFCSVCGVVGGGNCIDHFLVGVGMDLCMCGGKCIGRKGVSLWVRCSMLLMVSNGRFMFVSLIW